MKAYQHTMTASQNALALYCGDFAFEQDYLTKYLICGVCKMVMRNPMRLHRCGHTFCDKCILTPNCAECFDRIEIKQPDLTAANLVADSMVRCLAKDCPFKGTYENYINTHKNTCRMKNFNGLDSWMQKVKESLDDIPIKKPKPIPTVNCDVIQVAETANQGDPSVILENVTQIPNNFSEMQSLVIQSRVPRKIDVESLYHINPQNQARVVQQMKEMKEKNAPRRCQYGKHCKLMLEEGGCPYIHPEKDPRRQYQLVDKWAKMPIVRPPNDPPQILDDFYKRNKKDREDTQNFLNQYFPVQKLPDRKREPEVEIVPKPNKNKKPVIEL